MAKGIAALIIVSAILVGCDVVKEAPSDDGAKPVQMPELAVTTNAQDRIVEAAITEPVRTKPKVEIPKVAVFCGAGEETVFSCKTETGNDLAVCAAGEDVHYRFGKGSPDMSLMGARWATVGYSGGGEAQILFSNGNTDYIVFSRMIRTNFTPGEPNNPAISDGVIVRRGEKTLSMHQCEGGQAEKPVDYNLAEAAIANRGNELFTDETYLAD